MTLDECRVQTQKHIEAVRRYIRIFTDRLTTRAVAHDAAKLEPPEVELFAEYTPKLSEVAYGTQEYFDCLKGLRPALEHHYATYRHHPEHFAEGVNDMNLIDLVEMFADWKAASERQKNGNLLKSIELNAQRFQIGDQLTRILMNTAAVFDDIAQ